MLRTFLLREIFMSAPLSSSSLKSLQSAHSFDELNEASQNHSPAEASPSNRSSQSSISSASSHSDEGVFDSNCAQIIVDIWRSLISLLSRSIENTSNTEESTPNNPTDQIFTSQEEEHSRMYSVHSALSFTKVGEEIKDTPSSKESLIYENYFPATEKQPLSPIENPQSLEELLPIERKYQEMIQDLFRDLATSSILQLGMKAFTLSSMGAQLKTAVHPYRFLREILLCSASKEHLRNIYKDKASLTRGRIWGDFIGGIGQNFIEREKENNRMILRNAFARALDVDANQVLIFETNKNWGELVVYVAKDFES